MNDDLELLVSAYLDGDVTADERARVEASDELVREVERMRQVRALLGVDEPPAISMRERHLAATLDAWDRLPESERTGAARERTPTGVVAPPRPTRLDARRRRNRTWVMAAAAGLIVVLGGGIVLNGLPRGSGDDSTATEAPPLAAPSTDAPAADDSQLVEERGSASADELGVAADAPAEAESAVEELAEDEPIGGSEAAPPDDALPNLTSPNDLALFAVSALNATTSPINAQVTEAADGEADVGFDVRACEGVDIVVGPALYNGEQVIVGIDEDANEAVASAVDDCREIQRALLP